MVSCREYPIYIDDPSLYSEAIAGSRFFKTNLPLNAEIVKFAYYNNWNEDFDAFLALKFQSAEDLMECLKILAPSKFDSNGEVGCSEHELFIEMPNPYESSYTDLINLFFVSYTKEANFTGYEVNSKSDIILLNCNFGVISYSTEDLMIIQSAMQGTFSFGVAFDAENYKPKYFEYFNVAIDETTQRIYTVDEELLG